MKQLKVLVTIILTLFSSYIYSQPGDSLKTDRVIITTSLTDYLPTFKLNTGNFNLGSEIYLKNRNSLYANIGLIKSYGHSRGLFNISALRTHGMQLQIEGRHYINRHKLFEPAILLFWPHIFQYKSQPLPNTGYYFALHSSWQWTSTDRQEVQNVYTVDRNAIGLNILFGYQCVKRSGLTIDYSVGLGGQYISSSSTNRIGTDTDWPNSEKDYFSNRLFDKGKGFSPSFIYQLRFGWRL